jgi:hypothetical protein
MAVYVDIAQGRPPASPGGSGRLALGVLLAGALLVKLGLVFYLGERAYFDVNRAVNFGLGVQDGLISIRTHVDRTKTFVGPLVWSYLYTAAGVAGLKAFNLLAFVAFFLAQERVGRRLFARQVVLVALFLTAFYVGTNRNVSAGEPDDMAASLLFALGLLHFIRTDRIVGAGVLMGAGFLFKFWIAIFLAGFALHLAAGRRFRDLGVLGTCAAVPFLVVNLIDEFASVGALFATMQRQAGFSTWAQVALRFFSTGLLPAALLAAWAWRADPSERNRLLFLVPAPYVLYVVAARDAFAVTFVMMLCLFTWSFLVAGFLLQRLHLGARRGPLVGALALYAAGTAAISYHNLYRDTVAFHAQPGVLAPPSPGRLPMQP